MGEDQGVRKLFVLPVVLLLGTWYAAGQTETFHHVKIHEHRSAKDRVLVDRPGTLTFDDTNRKFTFEKDLVGLFDTPEKIEVPYDAFTKVVFEVTTHMRGGFGAVALEFVPIVGSVASNALAGEHVHDYWFYFEYKNGAESARGLIEIPKKTSARVIDKVTSLLGSRASVANFPAGEAIKPDALPDIKSKHSLKIDKQDDPLPVVKPDKATLVVVCPPLAARYSGKGNQFKLHANDQVVAVNKAGTYSFAYMDPGRYLLVSQSENANGFEMELEAGKTYYFLQNTFQGALKGETSLTRNSPELVSYLMSGTYFSEWARKKKADARER